MSIGARLVRSLKFGAGGFVAGWSASSLISPTLVTNAVIGYWMTSQPSYTFNTVMTDSSNAMGCSTITIDGGIYPDCSNNSTDTNSAIVKTGAVYSMVSQNGTNWMMSTMSDAVSSVPGALFVRNFVVGSIGFGLGAVYGFCSKPSQQHTPALTVPLIGVAVESNVPADNKHGYELVPVGDEKSFANNHHRLQFAAPRNNPQLTRSASDSALTNLGSRKPSGR